MLLVVGGMIGLGKTTVAEIIAEKFNASIYYESVDDNPILPLYYTESAEEIDRKRYPFLLQLYFLNSRFEAIKKAGINSLTGISVIDRSIYEDWYFAKLNYDLGRISDLEFSVYEKLLNNMMEELSSLPKKAPDLMIYLKGTFETVLKRIKSRGRAFELDPELIDYYKLLWEGYDKWLEKHYNASDILIIETDNLDYVNNQDDQEEIVNLVNNKLQEIKMRGR